MSKVFSIKDKQKIIEFEYQNLKDKKITLTYTPLSSKQRDEIKMDNSISLKEALDKNLKTINGSKAKAVTDEIYTNSNLFEFFIYLEGLVVEAKEKKSGD